LAVRHKHGNLSFIAYLYERHHFETETEVAARAVARVACHSLAPGDQLAEGGGGAGEESGSAADLFVGVGEQFVCDG